MAYAHTVDAVGPSGHAPARQRVEAHVVLAIIAQGARAEDEAEVVVVITRLLKRERAFERVVTTDSVRRIPGNSRGAGVQLNAAPHHGKRHFGHVVRVSCVVISAYPHLRHERGGNQTGKGSHADSTNSGMYAWLQIIFGAICGPCEGRLSRIMYSPARICLHKYETARRGPREGYSLKRALYSFSRIPNRRVSRHSPRTRTSSLIHPSRLIPIFSNT